MKRFGMDFEVTTDNREAITSMIQDAQREELRRQELMLAVGVTVGCGIAVIQSPWHTDYVLLPRHATIEPLVFPSWDAFELWRERQGWDE